MARAKAGLSRRRPAHTGASGGTLLHLFSAEAGVDLVVGMGEGPATPVGGFGGWKEVERQDDIAATAWTGQEGVKQDVPIMLDGWGERQSVQRQLDVICKLGRDAKGAEIVPPVFTMAGPIHFEELSWVLGSGGIEFSSDDDDVIRGTDGTLYRQALVLHCMEFVDPDEIKLRTKKRHRVRAGLTENVPLTHTVQKGETAESIAADVFGSWKEWHRVADKNGIRDPRRVLEPGRVLQL